MQPPQAVHFPLLGTEQPLLKALCDTAMPTPLSTAIRTVFLDSDLFTGSFLDQSPCPVFYRARAQSEPINLDPAVGGVCRA